MAVLNSSHLLEQASLLVSATPGRKPRQVNLRRAVSSAYYAVFHHILTAASDEFVGKGLRTDARYNLVYRSIDHAAVRRTCLEAARPVPSAKFQNYLPAEGFEPAIRSFANIFVRLQELRHQADYDPSQSMTSVDGMFSIYLAQNAIAEFDASSVEGKRLLLTILLFSPR